MAEATISFKPVKIGFLPTRRDVFSKEDAQKHKKLIMKKLQEWKVEFADIEWLNEEGLLYDGFDVTKVVEHFRKEEVDCIFAPHCNFGTEFAVATVGRDLGKPFLLWGPRDDAPTETGERTRDTQCGLFATGKILRRMGVPFTYIVNCHLEDAVFERGFRNFLGASAAVRQFKNMRVGQIAPRPRDFWTVMINEGELLERFGIEVDPVPLSEIVRRTKDIMSSKPKELKDDIADIKSRYDISNITEDSLTPISALKLAIKKWAEEEHVTAVGIQCWNALQDELSIMPCFGNSELTGMGLPVVCETDIHGAISAATVQAAALGSSPIFFADLTVRHPENDNAELIWHCGPFPAKLTCGDCKPKISRHFIMPSHLPGIGDWQIKSGDVTLARFDGDHGQYQFFMGHGKGVAGPHTIGTYIWVEVNDWPKWEEHLVCGPYIHHIVGVYGHVVPALYEATKFIPGVKPDPMDPTAEQIEDYLRGADL